MGPSVIAAILIRPDIHPDWEPMRGYGRDTLHFLRENARWLGGGFLLTLFSSFGQTFFIGLSGNDLRATFHLSAGGLSG